MLTPPRDDITEWYHAFRKRCRDVAEARNNAILASEDVADLFDGDRKLAAALAMPSEPPDAGPILRCVREGFDKGWAAGQVLLANGVPNEPACPYAERTTEWYAWWNGYLNQGSSRRLDAYLATLRSDPASPPSA